MCGIAGIYYFDRPAAPDAGARDQVMGMLHSMRHRGPDYAGAATYGGKCTLGMGRLAIVNTACEEAPYTNADDSLALVFNGQFYNYQEYESRLLAKYRYKCRSDTETLLHCFEEYGLDILDAVNGMYAIALYDARKDELHLIRDKAGEKFLYVYEDHEKVVFASEIKAILRVVAPVEQSCKTYDLFEACLGADTLFRNIKLIEPGYYLRFSGRQRKYVCYWNIMDRLIDVPDDRAKIKRDLTELICDAIAVRTSVSAYPYCCLVSGGVDSALIACIKKPDHLFSVTYENEGLGAEFSEIDYARAVAEHIGKELVIVRPTKEDFEQYRETIAWHLDTPATWTGFNYFMIFQQVAKVSRVALMGEGMDELFGGYHRYHFLYHDQQIQQLEALESYSYLINKYYGDPAERYIKLINRSDKLSLPEYERFMREIVKPFFDFFGDVVHAMGAFDFYYTMQIMLQMSDRMSMAHSVESRSPFLDHRLIQYAFSMPAKYKINHGVTKEIIKDIAKQFIPASIAERKDKRGFVVPFNYWYGRFKNGKYDRTLYRDTVYADWKKVFFHN